MQIDSTNDGVGKKRVKSKIACTHPGESKTIFKKSLKRVYM